MIQPQGIREHPWFNGALTPKMFAALDEMREEQRARDKMERAAVRCCGSVIWSLI